MKCTCKKEQNTYKEQFKKCNCQNKKEPKKEKPFFLSYQGELFINGFYT